MESLDQLQELLRKAEDYTMVQLEVWNVPIGDPMRAKLYFAVFNTRLAALIEANPPKNTPNPTASYALDVSPRAEPDRPTRDELLSVLSDLLWDHDTGFDISGHHWQNIRSLINREMNVSLVPAGLEIDTHCANSWATTWVNQMKYFTDNDRKNMPERYENDPELLQYDMYRLWLPSNVLVRTDVEREINHLSVWNNHVLPALQTFAPHMNWEI